MARLYVASQRALCYPDFEPTKNNPKTPMAIYHLSGTLISRSQGRSAVACSAYRSGERLIDERYQVIHDYTQKKDVVHKEMLLPEGAPDWMQDRETLWNAVEAHENRKDAQLAREFNFALPKELTLAQNIELARAYVQSQFVSQGMVADLCIHVDKTQDGELPHAHVMLTLRGLQENGFGPKVRAWNDKAQLLAWREAWAETANHHLALHGHELQIDHRTLEAQGIALEPQYKIGPRAAKARMARLADHQRIARENGERILAHPEIALKALTQQHSTFTHQDIARFVNRHSVDAEQFEAVYTKVKNHKNLVHLGLDAQKRERYTTQEMLSLETEMMKEVKVLSQCEYHRVSEPAKTQALATRSLSPMQEEGFHYLTESADLKCLVGFAGSGKSYLLGATREAFETQGYRVQGLTLSGIAAETLEGSSGIQSRTYASHSYYWEQGERKLTEKDILVVDEAGMLSSRQMARIVSEVNNSGAKLILVGDPEQLQAIEAGAAFRAILERSSTQELTEIHRQKQAWQQEATREFAQGKTLAALERYHDHIHEFKTQALAQENLLQLWNDARIAHPEKTQIILAYTRQAVQELNQKARELRRDELGPDHLIQTERGERQFAVEDRVYFLKNNRTLGVMNGTLGTIEAIRDKELTIRLDSDKNARELVVNLDQYKHLDHGYAATIHKAQGVTVDRSYLLASRYLDRQSTYVALSRHRDSVDVFWSREEFPHYRDLSQTLSRNRAKDVTLDYLASRSIEAPEKPEHQELRMNPISHRVPQVSPEQNRVGIRRPEDKLRAFRERFEAENPKRAEELREALRPSFEKAALKLETKFKDLEKTSGPYQDRLKQEILEAAKDLNARDYLKTQNKTLWERLEKLLQPQKEKAKEQAIERDFGIDR